MYILLEEGKIKSLHIMSKVATGALRGKKLDDKNIIWYQWGQCVGFNASQILSDKKKNKQTDKVREKDHIIPLNCVSGRGSNKCEGP